MARLVPLALRDFVWQAWRLALVTSTLLFFRKRVGESGVPFVVLCGKRVWQGWRLWSRWHRGTVRGRREIWLHRRVFCVAGGVVGRMVFGDIDLTFM